MFLYLRLSITLLHSSLLFQLLCVHYLSPHLLVFIFPFPLQLLAFFIPFSLFFCSTYQAAKQKESSHAQLKALSQQSESACRELTEVLGRLAQRDEELHRREVELMEARQRLLTLEQEAREVCG